MKKGFTLAEVLITLGIIGIIAALTIPNLIMNTNGSKMRAQFKKSIATLNQAGVLSESLYNFDFGGVNATCGTVDQETGEQNDNPKEVKTFCSLLNGTLTGATYYDKLSDIIISKTSEKSKGTYVINKNYTLVKDATAKYHAYQLADGSIVAFPKKAQNCYLEIGKQMSSTWITNHSECIGFVDANGATLPNEEVSCKGDGGKNTATKNIMKPCEVENNSNYLTDIFPIAFHDGTVEPASDAAKYILTTEK